MSVLRLFLVVILGGLSGVWAAWADEYEVIGDPAINVYLLPNCPGYNELLASQLRRHFKSLWDAEDSGYVRAADCNPVIGQKIPTQQHRSAAMYLPPPPPKKEGGQACLVLENLETSRKNGGKDSTRVALTWNTRVQNVCGFKILSTVLFQAVDVHNEKIFERAALIEVGEEQVIKFNESVTMPGKVYNSTARFQVAILWEEPVVIRPKRKPAVEEDD